MPALHHLPHPQVGCYISHSHVPEVAVSVDWVLLFEEHNDGCKMLVQCRRHLMTQVSAWLQSQGCQYRHLIHPCFVHYPNNVLRTHQVAGHPDTSVPVL